MFIIAGLGNPKKEYENTRHNVGFEVIDALADRYGIPVIDKKHRALLGKGVIEGQKVLLAKPLTYMNLSGESLREILDYYKEDPQTRLLVVCDDISLDVGQLRIRKKGSAGGHNGLKNIIANLGTQDFMRLRVGVGEKPAGYDLADYVLGHFPAAERRVMDESIKLAAEAAAAVLTEGPDEAMNRYNQKRRETEPERRETEQKCRETEQEQK